MKEIYLGEYIVTKIRNKAKYSFENNDIWYCYPPDWHWKFSTIVKSSFNYDHCRLLRWRLKRCLYEKY